MEIKTYQPSLARDPTLPSGIWDPAWNDPKVAFRVALDGWVQTLYGSKGFGSSALVAGKQLPAVTAALTEERRFALGEVRDLEGTRVRGGSFGEIFRRHTFGQERPPVNFHAQAVLFGADALGRWFLRANVGSYRLRTRAEAALVLRFLAAGKLLGGAAWRGTLLPDRDVPFVLTGTDVGLRSAFGKLSEATVSFYAKPA